MGAIVMCQNKNKCTTKMKGDAPPIQYKLEGALGNADRPGFNTGFLLKMKYTGLQIVHSFSATISPCALSNTNTSLDNFYGKDYRNQ